MSTIYDQDAWWQHVSRFPTHPAFANYAGTALIEIVSADLMRHRLSRRGGRQLNSALHTVATTQIRVSGSPGDAYCTRKIAEGKPPREAERRLKCRSPTKSGAP